MKRQIYTFLTNKFLISTQNPVENMDKDLKEKLLELVTDGNFEKTFVILYDYREQIPNHQRPIYNRLKDEFTFAGNHNIDYSQRVKSFIKTLEFEKK